jgi:hypothetical protein
MKLLYSPTGEYNKTEIFKLAASRFELCEIKINSVPKTTKDLCKNTKTIIRLRFGDYREILLNNKLLINLACSVCTEKYRTSVFCTNLALWARCVQKRPRVRLIRSY